MSRRKKYIFRYDFDNVTTTRDSFLNGRIQHVVHVFVCCVCFVPFYPQCLILFTIPFFCIIIDNNIIFLLMLLSSGLHNHMYSSDWYEGEVITEHASLKRKARLCIPQKHT